MDDPWGSPWASLETTSKHDTPTPSPPKSLLSPPPRAFFGSTSNLQSQSPWTGDIGFGDWTGTEQTDPTTDALDWGVWAEPSSHVAQPSPRLDDLLKRSSIALPSSAATSPGLRPLPRSRASSVFRHHSPDPWATEISLHDRRNDSPSRPSDALGITVTSLEDGAVERPIPSARPQEVDEIPEGRVDNTLSEEENQRILEIGSDVCEPPLSPDPKKYRNTGIGSAPKVEVQDSASRPSSTFSVDSFSAVERQDSPITSIDEDPKARLQTTSRKASGKVHELVGKYDDLSKIFIEEPLPSTRLDLPRDRSRGRSSSRTRSGNGEDEVDFGDFEDAKSEYDKPGPGFDVPLAFSGQPSTPNGQSREDHVQDPMREPPGHESFASGTASIPIQQLVEKFGPIQFDIDFQSIDKLFPGVAQEADVNTIEAGEIPDRVIEDNFTTISERKTWYRISRYGSMRKHDSGDEDNYHRVEWSTSSLHSDVIKIVRRWMEEDSIAGKATLGAGKRTSVFNWDSSAAPVDLGQVFSRKPPVPHTPKSSIPPPAQDSRRSTGSGSEPRRSIKSPIQPPDSALPMKATGTPGFGWSSGAQASSVHVIPSNNIGGDRIKSASRHTPAPIGTDTIHGKVRTTPQPNQAETTSEDEDDWGEMVSSPQIEAGPGPVLITQSLTTANGAASVPGSVSDSTSKSESKNVATAQSRNLATDLPVSAPQHTTAPKQVSGQTASSTAAPRGDPCRGADSSIFEPPLSGAASNPANSPKAKPKSNSKPGESKRIQARTDEVPGAQTPLKAVLGPIQKPSHGRDEDDIVKSIVHNLPDLSYMLR